MRRLRHRGFTLIELAVVTAIVAVLALIAMPLAELTAQRSRESELRTSLRQIREGIDAYKRAVDTGHVAKSVTESGYPRKLDDLVQGIEDISQPNKPLMYFMRRLPRDPFYPDPKTPAAETWGLRSYESAADHPSPGDDVFDVYSTSERAGLNGIPYRQW